MLKLIIVFLYIGAFSIGGGLATIGLIEAEIVGRLGWMTSEMLADMTAITEMTPGPIAVNAASFVGMRLYGLPGAFLATIADILPGCFMIYWVTRMNSRLSTNNRWQTIMAGLRAATVGLMISGALEIMKSAMIAGPVKMNILAIGCFLVNMVMIRKLKLNPMAGLLIGGIGGGILHLLLG